MHHQPAWAPDSADIERPSAARMYDYYLGGSHNFAADRALAEEYIKVLPEIKAISLANRAFLRRAVAHLTRAGINQFLDLGSGMPTAGNVHEVAGALDPDARVVYVDADPVTVETGARLLADVPVTRYLHADFRDPMEILGNRVVTSHLDFGRPVAVLMIAVLHFVPDEDDPAGIIDTFTTACVPGSFLVCSHATNEYQPETMREASGVYRRASHSMHFRSRAEISTLLQGYELLAPGLVDVIRWRPEPEDLDPYAGDVRRYNLLAGVGRKA
ncbi:MAG TPA: SAM-dependent methyltransferase [Actinospica sp.]|jgi:hypothetical protein|nr:SAM-dependent methyltransferase [Actinospica sp.]